MRDYEQIRTALFDGYTVRRPLSALI